MGVAIPFVYYLAWSNVKPILRVLSGGAAVMFLCSIMGTGSRGGAVGLVAAVAVLIARSRRRMAAGLVVVGVIAIAWTFASPAYKGRVATIAAPHERDLTAQTRMVSWKAAREMFADNPVTGVGAGNFMPAFVGRYGGSYRWSTTAHNVFYQAAAELGICGFLPFIAILICTLWRSIALNSKLVRAGLGATPMAAYAAALFPIRCCVHRGWLIPDASLLSAHLPHSRAWSGRLTT